MTRITDAPLSGRRAQAARNDGLILEAARAVFTADPAAPIAAVAVQAGVGISALYRRYRTKDELLQRLSADGMRQYLDFARAALADTQDPGAAFERFMYSCLDAGAGSLTLRLAGTFAVPEELAGISIDLYEAIRDLVARTKATGVLREEITEGDLTLVWEQLQSVRIGDEARTLQLRHRYMAMLLQAFRMPSGTQLPGPPPSREEIRRRYGD